MANSKFIEKIECAASAAESSGFEKTAFELRQLARDIEEGISDLALNLETVQIDGRC